MPRFKPFCVTVSHHKHLFFFSAFSSTYKHTQLKMSPLKMKKLQCRGSLAFNPGCDFALLNKMCDVCVSQTGLESFLVKTEIQLGCRIVQTHTSGYLIEISITLYFFVAWKVITSRTTLLFCSY